MCLWCLIFGCGIIVSYLCLISIISIWIGIAHVYQSGWWVPVVAGSLFLTGVLVGFVRASKKILRNIKQKGVLLP